MFIVLIVWQSKKLLLVFHDNWHNKASPSSNGISYAVFPLHKGTALTDISFGMHLIKIWLLFRRYIGLALEQNTLFSGGVRREVVLKEIEMHLIILSVQYYIYTYNMWGFKHKQDAECFPMCACIFVTNLFLLWNL